jgi:hypothetical protein
MHRSLKQRAQVHLVQVTPGDLEGATYTIDWLENLPASPFIWPDTFKTVTTTTTTRSIGLADESITISGSGERSSTGRAAVRLTIAGVTFYVCVLSRDETTSGIMPGCIIYVGTPNKLFRKKVRTALSFALGVYLVDLGYTLYDQQWHIVSAVARSAYSLGRRAFELGPGQLAPLGPQYLYELGRSELARMVGALIAAYDELDLGNLSWAYWHACTATVHIAPAHFGAAIEALQRAYILAHPGAASKVIIPRKPWQGLRAAMAATIAKAGIPDESKRTLTCKLFNLNRTDQRPLLKAVLDAIGLRLGDNEDSAWKRRNEAAHGIPIPEGEELAAIRDMKLLRGLFHRMLLRMANAADLYIDYVSPDNPYRRLEEPPPCSI